MTKQDFIIRNAIIRDRAIDYIRNLDLSVPHAVTIQPFKKPRTLSQNRLMWMWLNEVAQIVGNELGYDADDMHEVFKAKFLPASGRKLVKVGDAEIERLTTTALTTAEMTAYMEAIDRFCTVELGMVLPHPEDLQRHA